MRKQRLLVVIMSAALISIASTVGYYTQAAPQNSTAIEASCKNNVNKKSWCSEVPLVKPVLPTEPKQLIAVELKPQSFQQPVSEPEHPLRPEQNQPPDLISKLEFNQPDLEPNQPPEPEAEINFGPDLEPNQPPEPEAEINFGDEVNLNNTTIAEIVALTEQQLGLLSAEDIATLPIEVMFYFNVDQFRYFLVNLTHEAKSGFTAYHLAALNIDAMAAFDAQTLAELDPLAVKGFDVNQLLRLDPTVMAGFTTQQWENLAITRESPTLLIIPEATEIPLPGSQVSDDVVASLVESKNIQLDGDRLTPSVPKNEPTVTEPSEAIVTEEMPTVMNEDIQLNRNLSTSSDPNESIVTTPSEAIKSSPEELTATEVSTIENPKDTMNPIYWVEQKTLILPEVQFEMAGEIFSYEVTMKASGDNMKLAAAQLIESNAQPDMVISTLSLETGELIIPLIEMIDSLGVITAWQVRLQWIQFNPLIFKINHISSIN